jgi:hypothetical protein
MPFLTFSIAFDALVLILSPSSSVMKSPCQAYPFYGTIDQNK